MKHQYIERRSGPGGTSAYINGTRVRVSDIARLYGLLQSETIAERIRRSLPHLTPPQIEDAIAYWRANQKEIDAEIEEEEKLLSNVPTRM